MPKDFLTVAELQDICESLNLSTDGLKSELITRIIDFTQSKSPSSPLPLPPPPSPSTAAAASQSAVSQAKTTTIEKSTQTPDDGFRSQSIKWFVVAVLLILAIGFAVGLIIYCRNETEEKIEIVLKHRPWFEF